MGFDHAHNLKHVTDIAKEDHIGLVRMAAQAWSQVGTRTSHQDRGGGELIAFAAKLAHEPLRDDAAAAPLSYILRNRIQVVPGSCG